MIDVSLITIDYFLDNIYDKYIKLFPSDEQRDWNLIKKSYDNRVEVFYKITLDNVDIGFFMLEKIDNHPYYLDYFGIYSEYQNKGYGTIALKHLLSNIINDGLLIEIEKVDSNKSTIRRCDFYKRLGFKLIDSEYLLYKVLYNPLIYSNNNYSKEEIDKLIFDYYIMNCGIDAVKKNCSIIR